LGETAATEPYHHQRYGEYLANRARRSGVNFVAPVQIEFQSEESVVPGSVRVAATFHEKADDLKTGGWKDGNKQVVPSGGEHNSMNGTQVYKMPPAAARSDARAELVATGGFHEGQTWPLGQESVCLGRGVGSARAVTGSEYFPQPRE